MNFVSQSAATRREWLKVALTLYPKRSTQILLCLVSGIFVALGIFMVVKGEPFGYLCAAFFFLLFLVAIVQLFPGSSYLEIGSEGFTICL